MGELKRIDVAAVPAMFARHGIVPERGSFFRDAFVPKPCGCLVSALVIDSGEDGLDFLRSVLKEHKPWDTPKLIPAFASRLGLDPRYVNGLVFGWDGSETMGIYPEFLAGRADAAAAWEACQPLLAKGA